MTEGVEKGLEHSLRLEHLAELASMSPFHFSREFARAAGETPHRFVVRRRLQRAVELLASPALAVSDVARLCGFSHASRLARHMRRQTGVTPAQLRELVPP